MPQQGNGCGLAGAKVSLRLPQQHAYLAVRVPYTKYRLGPRALAGGVEAVKQYFAILLRTSVTHFHVCSNWRWKEMNAREGKPEGWKKAPVDIHTSTVVMATALH
jgi:hypothetical protein